MRIETRSVVEWASGKSELADYPFQSFRRHALSFSAVWLLSSSVYPYTMLNPAKVT
jgi:hypothetical protein